MILGDNTQIRAVQCSVLDSSTVQCGVVQFNRQQCSAVQAVQWCVMQSTMHHMPYHLGSVIQNSTVKFSLVSHSLSICIGTQLPQPTSKIYYIIQQDLVVQGVQCSLYKLGSVYCTRCDVCIVQGVQRVLYKVCIVYCTKCALCIVQV